MLDITLVRENPEEIKKQFVNLGEEPGLVDEILELDTTRRNVQTEIDAVRADMNRLSKGIGNEKDPEKRRILIADVGVIKAKKGPLEEELKDANAKFSEKMLWLPNLPLEEVPVGHDDSENVVIEEDGNEPSFSFEPKSHWELGESLGILDMERGQKVSGSKFYFLKGAGARLQRALITWMLDVHTREFGYTEIYPPYMVRSHTLFGTGNLPKFGDNLYKDHEEDFWWIPTAEVPVTNYHRDEVLDEKDLPVKYAAYSACFRREKMHHGAQLKGIKRGHQFDKVELVHLTTPEAGRKSLDDLVTAAREILKRLGLRHRVLKMCTGDLSFVSCLKFDLETWSPAMKEWLEVSSCGLFSDFQARRANIRFRGEDGKLRHVYTMNGSALALPRTMISILETYQNEDGSVTVPEVLRPYMGMDVIK